MHIAFELIPDDLLSFAVHHYEHSPAMRRSRRRYQVGVAALILITTTVMALQEQSGVYFLVGTVGAVVWILAWPRYVRWSVVRQTKRLYSEGTNSALLGLHRLDVRDDGLACMSPTTESLVRWPALERVVETPDHAFLYMGAAQAIVIPRARVTEGEFDAFVAAVDHAHVARGV